MADEQGDLSPNFHYVVFFDKMCAMANLMVFDNYIYQLVKFDRYVYKAKGEDLHQTVPGQQATYSNKIASPQRKKVVSANSSLFRRNKKLFLSIPFLTATSKSSYKTS